MTTKSSKMRVLQVIPTLSAGGAEGFVTNLGVSLGAVGAEVKLFLLAGVRGERGKVLQDRLHKAGIEVVGSEERKTTSLSNLLRLTRLIRSWKPHIVQANLYAGEVACAWARVLSLGGGTHYVRRLANTEQCGYRSAWKVRMLEWAYRLTIANSPSVARAYSDFLKKAVNGRLVTIANGAHLLGSVPTPEEKAEARHALGIPDKAFVVTHIGRMWPGMALEKGLEGAQKAQDVLMKAFSQACGGDPDSVLLLVGDGPLRPEAEGLARSLGLDQQARFLGEYPEPWPALKAADLFCFPSRHEGLPNVLPEAASCGLPVVASDIQEIRDLSPGAGWLLEPVDDISRFADALRIVRERKNEFSRKACAAAQGFREDFSMKTCAEKYVRAYESALGCKKRK